MGLLWLKGMIEIVRYTNREIPEILSWIVTMDFPAFKRGEVWVARRFKVRRWLKKYAKEIKREDILPPVQSKQRKIIQRRW